MHHNSILIKTQLDATVCRHLFTAESFYMFRVSQHPSSGVLKTVTAASGTGHNIGTATSLRRGLIGTANLAFPRTLHKVYTNSCKLTNVANTCESFSPLRKNVSVRHETPIEGKVEQSQEHRSLVGHYVKGVPAFQQLLRTWVWTKLLH